ncbi:hypothetical protein CR513_48521, partial [Mucuna pruriens]
MTLSNDEIFEIFSWLPAKTIYKFKSNSKLFSKLLEESYFASKQAQNALLKDDTCFFIQPDTTIWHNGQIELHPLPGEELSSGVSNDVLILLSNSAKILSSSNGLILCHSTNQNQRNSPYFRPYIMSYNFEDGKSRMLRVPKEARKGSHDYTCDMRIFKWGKVTNENNQSICLVRLRKRVFTIWVLTKYELCLWRRILKVRVKAMGVVEKDPIVKGFVVLNGDLLVFATEKKVDALLVLK